MRQIRGSQLLYVVLCTSVVASWAINAWAHSRGGSQHSSCLAPKSKLGELQEDMLVKAVRSHCTDPDGRVSMALMKDRMDEVLLDVPFAETAILLKPEGQTVAAAMHIVYELSDGSVLWAHDGAAAGAHPMMAQLGKAVHADAPADHLHWAVFHDVPSAALEALRMSAQRTWSVALLPDGGRLVRNEEAGARIRVTPELLGSVPLASAPERLLRAGYRWLDYVDDLKGLAGLRATDVGFSGNPDYQSAETIQQVARVEASKDQALAAFADVRQAGETASALQCVGQMENALRRPVDPKQARAMAYDLAPLTSAFRRFMPGYTVSSSSGGAIEVRGTGVKRMMEADRKERIAKLMDYYLAADEIPAVSELIQNYFLGVDLWIDPVQDGTYRAVVGKDIDEIIVDKWITFHGVIDDGIQDTMKKLKARGFTEHEVTRIADFFLLPDMLHEIHALKLLCNYPKDAVKDAVEGELFEVLMEPLFYRSLPKPEYDLLIEFNDYVYDFVTEPRKKSIIKRIEELKAAPTKSQEEWKEWRELHAKLRHIEERKGVHKEHLDKWRNLDEAMFEEVIMLSEKGIQWFEQNSLQYFTREVTHDGRSIPEVIEKNRRTKELTGIWEPILDRKLLKRMDEVLNFQSLASQIRAMQNIEKRQEEALQKMEAAILRGDHAAAEQWGKTAIFLDSHSRAFKLVASYGDIKELSYAAEDHPSREIAIPLDMLVKLEKDSKERWTENPHLGQRLDLLAMRNFLFNLIGRDKTKITDPKEQVRIHILIGDFPEEDAIRIIQNSGLIDHIGVIAKDIPQLIERIELLRNELLYDPIDQTKDAIYYETFVVIGEENEAGSFANRQMGGAGAPIQWKWESLRGEFKDLTVLVAAPGASVGESIFLGFILDLLRKYLVPSEEAAQEVKKALELILPWYKVRGNLVGDPYSTFRMGGNAERSQLLDRIHSIYSIVSESL